MKNKKQTNSAYGDEVDQMYHELEEAQSGNAKKAHNLGKIIANVLFVILICLLIFCLIWVQVAKENNQTPLIFGFGLCYVETGSMEPTLPTGSIILVKEVEDTSSLEKGDIITFYDQDRRRITHRIDSVITINGEIVYVTKGDNNNTIDILSDGSTNYLTQDRIIAIMIKKLF